MEQAIHSIVKKPEHTVEIVVHVTETLEEQRRRDLVAALAHEDGFVGAEFCPSRYHLLLVRYDTDMYSSKDALARITSQNVNAQLIGPV